MERRVWSALLVFTLLGTYGCSKPAATEDFQAAADAPAAEPAAPALTPEQVAIRNELKGVTDTPQKAVHEFLSAVVAANHEHAGMMLTDLALKKTSEHDMVVAPPGSPTAKFSVTDVEYVTEDKTGAHVFSTWTDLDENGQPSTDMIVWILRQEDYGWRIAGMATTVFEGEPPLIVNFEDPEDIVRKTELAQQEHERRMAAQQQGQPEGGQPGAQGQQPAVQGQAPGGQGAEFQAQQPVDPAQPTKR